MIVIAVDDELLALRDLTEVIHTVLPQADIHGFQSPVEALAYARSMVVSIAFLDIRMQGISGLELAKQLKDARGETNIVFVTGFSQYALDAFSVCASDYILKPAHPESIQTALERLRHPIKNESGGLRVQCFGNFEVFYDGKPVRFPRSKAKELFAYLVHKCGTGCTTRELAGILYEDKAYDSSLSHQIQVIISVMMRTLDGIGCRDTVIKHFNSISVDSKRLDCDYYRFLSWDLDAINSYFGEYMANYSWAEFIVGYLDRKIS